MNAAEPLAESVEIAMVAEVLLTLGTHHIKNEWIELTTRCCNWLPQWGSKNLVRLVDFQVIQVSKAYRGKGVFTKLLHNVVDTRLTDSIVKFSSVINPRFEGFLIRHGCVLVGKDDYVLLRVTDWTS